MKNKSGPQQETANTLHRHGQTDHAGPGRNWRIRNPTLEMRNKLEMRMIQTNQNAPNEANPDDWGLEIMDWGFVPAGTGMSNEANVPGSRRAREI